MNELGSAERFGNKAFGSFFLCIDHRVYALNNVRGFFNVLK